MSSRPLSQDLQRLESETDHSEISSSPIKKLTRTKTKPSTIQDHNNDFNDSDIIGMDEDEINKELVKWAGKLEMESIELREKSDKISLGLEHSTKALETMTINLKESLQIFSYDQKNAFSIIGFPLEELSNDVDGLKDLILRISAEFERIPAISSATSNNEGLPFGDFSVRMSSLEQYISSALGSVTKSLHKNSTVHLNAIIDEQSAKLDNIVKRLDILESNIKFLSSKRNGESFVSAQNNHSGINAVILNNTLNKLISRMDGLSNSSTAIQYHLGDISRNHTKLSKEFSKFKEVTQSRHYESRDSRSRFEPREPRRPPTSNQIEQLGDDERPIIMAKKFRFPEEVVEEDSIEMDSSHNERQEQILLLTPATSITSRVASSLEASQYNSVDDITINKEVLYQAALEIFNAASGPLSKTLSPEQRFNIGQVYLKTCRRFNRDTLLKIQEYECERDFMYPIRKLKIGNVRASQGFCQMYLKEEATLDDLRFVRNLRIQLTGGNGILLIHRWQKEMADMTTRAVIANPDARGLDKRKVAVLANLLPSSPLTNRSKARPLPPDATSKKSLYSHSPPQPEKGRSIRKSRSNTRACPLVDYDLSRTFYKILNGDKVESCNIEDI